MKPMFSKQLVKHSDARPAGKPGECFYCNEKVGAQHRAECVAATRMVVVRYSIEVEVEVPESWDSKMIEFHRSGNSWLASLEVER